MITSRIRATFPSALRCCRPDCFSHLSPGGTDFWCFHWDGVPIFYFATQLFLPTNEVLCHVVMLRKGPKAFHWASGVFEDEVIPAMQTEGVRKLVVCKADFGDAERWGKFVSFFGFGEPITLLYSERAI